MSRRTLKIAVLSAAVALSAGIGLATATSGSAAVQVPATQFTPAPAGKAPAVDGVNKVGGPVTAPAEPTLTNYPDPGSTIEPGTCAACVFPPE